MSLDINDKICIHNYLNKCETGSMPPGFVDFLKGTIALYNYSKKYNYKLFINRDIHPIFKYFEDCEYYINDTHSIDCTFELLSQANPIFVDHILQKLFQNGFSFSVITNCLINDINSSDFGLNGDCRNFLLKILKPTKIIEYKINKVLNDMNINSNYYCIHIRFGDKYINSNLIDYKILNILNESLLKKIDYNTIVLVSDSKYMSNELIKMNNNLHYWDNNKIHTGSLNNYNEEAIQDMLVDFYILAKSSKIITINVDSIYFTTFSPVISKIFNIDNDQYQLNISDTKIDSLALYEPIFNKIRLGKDYDGGYIICDLLNVNYDCLISAGIDNDISFEESFCDKYNIPCYAYDGTIDNIEIKNKNIKFIKKNIGEKNTEKTTNLHEIININKSIFLKMDIEGAEFDWIESLSLEQLQNISQIVIEFHHDFNSNVFNKLNSIFYLVHFHGNNFCGYKFIDNVAVPNVFECTYINKKYITKQPKLNTKTLPIEIDMKNIKELVDHYIDYPPFVHKY